MNYQQHTGETITLTNNTTIGKTMTWLRKLARAGSKEPAIKEIARKLREEANKHGEDYCIRKAVFDFVYDNVYYEPDPENVQALKYPVRTLADKKGNCADYAILISSILINLEIPHKFRIVKFDTANGYEHIYIVSQGKVMDPTIGQKQDGTDNFNNRPRNGQFDTEIEHKIMKDYEMPDLIVFGSSLLRIKRNVYRQRKTA